MERMRDGHPAEDETEILDGGEGNGIVGLFWTVVILGVVPICAGIVASVVAFLVVLGWNLGPFS